MSSGNNNNNSGSGRYKVRGRPKVGHKKSRYGCEKCKKRRVKCDEVRPICSNCSRLRLECRWAEHPFEPRIQSPNTALLPHAAASSLSPAETESSVCLSVAASTSAPTPGRLSATPARRFSALEPGDGGEEDTLFGHFSGHNNDSTTSDLLLPESRERRMLEHELVQNYVFNMATPFATAPTREWEDLFHKRLPRLTLKYDNVLFSLCANSATHMLQQGCHTSSEPKLVNARQAYLVAAMREQRLMVDVLTTRQRRRQELLLQQQQKQQQLQPQLQPQQQQQQQQSQSPSHPQPSPRSGDKDRDADADADSITADVDTADAVCLASLLLMVHSFATLQTRPLEPYVPPLEWLQMGRGAGALIRASAEAISSLGDECAGTSLLNLTDVYPRFSLDVDSYYIPEMLAGLEDVLLAPPRLPGDKDDHDHNHNHNEHDNYDNDDDWLDENDAETRDAYTKTLGYVGSVCDALRRGEPAYAVCTRIQAFAFLVPHRFFDLLERRRPRALVILAHFFAASAQVRDRDHDVWWLGNSPSHGYEPTPRREICAIHRTLPPRWRPLMAAPLEAVGLSLTSCP